MDSQDSLSDLLPPPEVSEPVTPQPAHASIPDGTRAAVSKLQSSRINNTTPPPSTQVNSSTRGKTRTPTPTISHISTPPPTVEMPSQSHPDRMSGAYIRSMSADEVAAASPDELRKKVTELQAAFHEAKMSAAHHKLQYQMLSQESAAAIERMAVEARMAQYENDVIHVAEQHRAAATPVQPPPMQEGMIAVQKDLYQRMCRDIQSMMEAKQSYEREHAQQEKLINRQESEIASLSDKVTLMRERIRENRDHLHKMRARPSISTSTYHVESTPRSSLYSTPHRAGQEEQQSQPFAALLQASEMASQRMGTKKGHTRNTHSLSSLPATPSARTQKHGQNVIYQTPSNRHPPIKIPATAPMPRTSALRTPSTFNNNNNKNNNVYTPNPTLPVPLPQSSIPQTRGPPSDGTVSASDQDVDSDAETDIFEPSAQDDTMNVSESQASRAASQMLRLPSHSHNNDEAGLRESLKGSGMLRQTKLFGAVRKAGVERGGGGGGGGPPPAKRARIGGSDSGGREVVGLGIEGVRD